MSLSSEVKFLKMRQEHIREVFRLAQENKLSFWSYDDYALEGERKESFCLVAICHDVVVAFIILRLIMSEKYGEILNIAVKDSMKRKGIGREILTKAIKYCIHNKLDTIFLEVRESNVGAIKLYASNGFEILGKRRNFYDKPIEDALVMSTNIANSV